MRRRLLLLVSPSWVVIKLYDLPIRDLSLVQCICIFLACSKHSCWALGDFCVVSINRDEGLVYNWPTSDSVILSSRASQVNRYMRVCNLYLAN